MAITRVMFLLLVFSLLTGCGTTVQVTVDSIHDAERAVPGKAYVITSGMPDISVDDLYFREFSTYFQKVLEKKGYSRVANRAEADLEIRLSYGISEGRNIYFTYDRPIYDFIGGETIVYTTTRRSEGGKTSKTTETVHVPTRHALIGYATETASRTVHTSFVIVEARRISGEGKDKTAWKTTLRHSSEMNDLRWLMPYFAAAAMPYLGEDTGMAKTVELKPSNETVRDIQFSGRR